jgi:hypothetical protein
MPRMLGGALHVRDMFKNSFQLPKGITLGLTLIIVTHFLSCICNVFTM